MRFAASFLLFLLALALFLALGPGGWHFSAYRPDNSSWIFSPMLLPVLVLALGILRGAKGRKRGQRVLVLLSVAAFLGLHEHLGAGLLLLAWQLGLFACDRFLPRSFWSSGTLVVLAMAYLAVPLVTAAHLPQLFQENQGTMALLRECFTLRTVSWIVFRRVYERRDFSGVWDYLEYFFCPVFFLVPSLLNLVGYGYFHERKGEPDSGRASLLLGAWGLLLMGAYSWLSRNFTEAWLGPFLWARPPGVDHWFLFGGFVSFVMVVLHHTGAMSFQVGLARALGYRLRYDMIFPLLARSPMELWRREHNYTRQYLLETFLRPVSLFGLRRGWPKAVTIPVAALIAYGLMTMALSGWRAFEPPMTAVASAGMLTFFAFSLTVPILFWASETRRGRRSRPLRLLLGEERLVPLKSWRALDFVFWLGTLLAVSAGKAAIGAARVWTSRN